MRNILKRFLVFVIIFLVPLLVTADEVRTNAESGGDTVNITGGTINGTVIGEETPAAGSFTTGSFTDTVDHNGNYVTNLQNFADAGSCSGGEYWFDGTNDHGVVGDDAILSMGDSANDNPFSVIARVRMNDATSFPVISKGIYNTTGEWRLLVDASDKVNFQTFDESVADCYIGRSYNTALTAYEGDWVYLAGTYDGMALSSGFNIYLNGVDVDDTDAENNPGTYVAMENGAADLHIGRDDTDYGEGSGSQYYLFNLELTATEIMALSSGASVPFEYVGANQTLVVPSDDCAVDNTANWTDVNGALSHAASEYTYTVTTGANVASFTDEAALTIGKRYRATVLVKDGTGAGATVRIRALTNAGVEIVSGTSITVAVAYAIATVEWTATETDNKVQVEIVAASVADTETVLFDTIRCNRIGCILQLESSGIGGAAWVDNSGNDLHGSVTGGASATAAVDDRDFKTKSFTNAAAQTTFIEANMIAYSAINNQGAGEETDIILVAVSYPIKFAVETSEAFQIELCPPAGELFNHDRTLLDANDCILSSATVGDSFVVKRMQIADGSWRYHTMTVQGVNTDGGAAD